MNSFSCTSYVGVGSTALANYKYPVMFALSLDKNEATLYSLFTPLKIGVISGYQKL
jgi:hypothetical protein